MTNEETKTYCAALFNVGDPTLDDLGTIIIKQTELVADENAVMAVKIQCDNLIGTISIYLKGFLVLTLESGKINTGDIVILCDSIDAIDMDELSDSLIIKTVEITL